MGTEHTGPRSSRAARTPSRRAPCRSTAGTLCHWPSLPTPTAFIYYFKSAKAKRPPKLAQLCLQRAPIPALQQEGQQTPRCATTSHYAFIKNSAASYFGKCACVGTAICYDKRRSLISQSSSADACPGTRSSPNSPTTRAVPAPHLPSGFCSSLGDSRE